MAVMMQASAGFILIASSFSDQRNHSITAAPLSTAGRRKNKRDYSGQLPRFAQGAPDN
jgi:hypothetical protein